MRLSGPSRVNGTDCAAPANSMSGTAVTIPVPSTRTQSAVPAVWTMLSSPRARMNTTITAGTNETNVSPARLSIPSSGDWRFTSAYRLHVAAMTSAIHGGRPYDTVSTTTATAAAPKANFWAPVGASWKMNTPRSIVSRGARKYPSAVSMTRSWPTAHT